MQLKIVFFVRKLVVLLVMQLRVVSVLTFWLRIHITCIPLCDLTSLLGLRSFFSFANLVVVVAVFFRQLSHITRSFATSTVVNPMWTHGLMQSFVVVISLSQVAPMHQCIYSFETRFTHYGSRWGEISQAKKMRKTNRHPWKALPSPPLPPNLWGNCKVRKSVTTFSPRASRSRSL